MLLTILTNLCTVLTLLSQGCEEIYTLLEKINLDIPSGYAQNGDQLMRKFPADTKVNGFVTCQSRNLELLVLTEATDTDSIFSLVGQETVWTDYTKSYLQAIIDSDRKGTPSIVGSKTLWIPDLETIEIGSPLALRKNTTTPNVVSLTPLDTSEKTPIICITNLPEIFTTPQKEQALTQISMLKVGITKTKEQILEMKKYFERLPTNPTAENLSNSPQIDVIFDFQQLETKFPNFKDSFKVSETGLKFDEIQNAMNYIETHFEKISQKALAFSSRPFMIKELSEWRQQQEEKISPQSTMLFGNQCNTFYVRIVSDSNVTIRITPEDSFYSDLFDTTLYDFILSAVSLFIFILTIIIGVKKSHPVVRKRTYLMSLGRFHTERMNRPIAADTFV